MRNSNKGFTLAELLIVVAIIGVLTAVAIPVFTTQLEKSREATDIANMRSAKAAAVALYLDSNQTATYFFDAQKGVLVEGEGVQKDTVPAAMTVGYGKGTAKNGGCGDQAFYMSEGVYYTGTTEASDKVIQVVITDTNAANGEATFALSWVAPAAVVPGP